MGKFPVTKAYVRGMQLVLIGLDVYQKGFLQALERAPMTKGYHFNTLPSNTLKKRSCTCSCQTHFPILLIQPFGAGDNRTAYFYRTKSSNQADSAESTISRPAEIAVGDIRLEDWWRTQEPGDKTAPQATCCGQHQQQIARDPSIQGTSHLGV